MTDLTDTSGTAGQPVPTPRLAPIAVLARGVTTFFVIWIVTRLALEPFSFDRIADYEAFDSRGLPANDAAAQLLGLLKRELPGLILQIVVFTAAGIAFLIWLYRARANAEQLSPLRHRRSRGWLFWGWLTPVVSFWVPYQIVADLRKASLGDNPARHAGPSRKVLNWWWGLFLLSQIGSSAASFVVRRGSTELEILIASAQIRLIADLVLLPAGIAAAILAIHLVRSISASQRAQYSQA